MKVAPLRRLCTICSLPEVVRAQANRVIWDEQTGKRTKGYRVDTVALLADLEMKLEEKSVTRHADHVEASWRDATEHAPAGPLEETLFSTDFGSVTDAAAMLGQKAMAKLHGRLDSGMEDKDLIAVAKLGVTSATARANLAVKRAELNLTAAAIFGVASGHADVPEAEAIDVTPVADLKGEVRREREALLLAAGYE